MPNILHLMSDQHLAMCMGAAGEIPIHTPHLDRLAREGMSFTRAYTQSPICTPSRVSTFSGQYCHNHGYYGLYGPTPPNLPNLYGHLRRHGYRTAAIGKIHLPNDPVDWIAHDVDWYRSCYTRTHNTHQRRGIQSEYYDYLEALGLRDKEDSALFPEFREQGTGGMDGRPSLLPYRHSPEGWCVIESQRFIEDCGDEPFYLHVSFVRPHQLLTPAQEFWDQYEDCELPDGFDLDIAHRAPHFRAAVEAGRKAQGMFDPQDNQALRRRTWRGYLACISQVDHAVGELLASLEASGKLEDTIILYHADHGAYMGMFGVPEKSPGICSEMVCRIPFIWRGPGIEAQQVSRALVENVDIAPTLTDLCGVPAMDSTDGLSLVDLLAGENRSLRDMAVTENPWSKGVRFDRWRYTHYPEGLFDEPFGELYDLESDPLETRNLFFDAETQETVNACRQALLDWLIKSTRPVTSWPSLNRPRKTYAVAGDGKATPKEAIQERIRRGMLDYL